MLNLAPEISSSFPLCPLQAGQKGLCRTTKTCRARFWVDIISILPAAGFGIASTTDLHGTLGLNARAGRLRWWHRERGCDRQADDRAQYCALDPHVIPGLVQAVFHTAITRRSR